jgi:acetyltransferase
MEICGKRFMSPGYPSEWERAVYTRDGVAYRIRPIRTDDAVREREFLIGLSSESRYMRMMYTMCEPSPDLVARFVHVDYRLNMAFAAIAGRGDDERIVGVARYAADSEGELEFALVVTDAWQGRGVGATLTRLLFDYARVQGIRRLCARILATNQRMIEFVRWLGMNVHSVTQDPTVLKASLDL